MSVCHKICQEFNSPDAVIRVVCLAKHQMLFALYLTLSRFFDDSNLLFSDISLGDEMKPN
jgi:hypothetical protein